MAGSEVNVPTQWVGLHLTLGRSVFGLTAGTRLSL
jgi:hypothetical protein